MYVQEPASHEPKAFAVEDCLSQLRLEGFEGLVLGQQQVIEARV